MSNEFMLFIIGGLIVAIAVHAYNMGWQAGHDIHHEEPNNGPRNEPEPPRTLYR